jgi:hypothetical protein
MKLKLNSYKGRSDSETDHHLNLICKGLKVQKRLKNSDLRFFLKIEALTDFKEEEINDQLMMN